MTHLVAQVFGAVVVLAAWEPSPPTVTIDVVKQFGDGPHSVSFDGLHAAMAKASDVLQSGQSATLFFQPGTFRIDMPGALFNLSGLAAPGGRRFTIAGAGMLQTTLNLTTHGHDVVASQRGTARFTLRDITFARPMLTTTQGTIVAADAGSLTLQLDAGYPPLDQLLVDRIPRLSLEQGLFIRRFRRAAAGAAAEVVTPALCSNSTCAVWPPAVNAQLHFTCGGDGARCPDISSPRPGVWKLHVASWSPGLDNPDTHELARYQADAASKTVVVGVKIKHGGQSFNVRNCHDIVFDSVRWLGHSRGILHNCTDVVLRHTRVDRAVDDSALGTPGGGPQVAVCNNLTVFNHSAAGTGDDALALFDVAAGTVRGCNIRDSFARGILLCRVSDDVAASVLDPKSRNAVIRSPIYRPDPTTCSY